MPVADIEEQKLRSRIRELARSHVRWGRRLAYRRLRLEGWTVNHKRVQRIWAGGRATAAPAAQAEAEARSTTRWLQNAAQS